MLLFVVVHVKQFKFGTWYQRQRQPVRDLYRTEVEVFQHPLWVAFYVDLHAARRPAPAARHLERVPVARPRSSGLHAAARRRWGIVLAILIGGGLAIIPIWVYFRDLP